MNSSEQQTTPPVATPQTVYVANHTSGEAIASLVLGILAWPTIAAFGFGIVFGILAVIFGHLARGKIRRAQPPGSIGGDGMAIIGLILGYIAIAIGLIVLLFVGGMAAAFLGAAMSH